MKVLLQETSFTTAWKSYILGGCIGLCSSLLICGWIISIAYADRIFPNTTIAGMPVGNMTKSQAHAAVTQHLGDVALLTTTLSDEGVTISSSSAQLGLTAQVDTAVDAAFAHGRSDSKVSTIKDFVHALFWTTPLTITYSYHSEALENFVELFSQRCTITGAYPHPYRQTNGALAISEGKLGRSVHIPETVALLQKNARATDLTLAPIVVQTGKIAQPDQMTKALERAARFQGDSLVLTYDTKRFTISEKDLFSFIDIQEGYIVQHVSHYLDSIATQVNRAPENAVFTFDSHTLKVTTFTPDRDGVQLDKEASIENINTALHTLEGVPDQRAQEAVLIAQISPAQTTLGSLNTLGISKRIAFSESLYEHSIPTRVFNVAHASEKVNNVIVKPGDEFSFNKTIGEISRRTGFKPAYVISGGRTILGDGGGVCQVSTTLFRAVLNGGLRVTRRLPHSYRVSYYELNADPGFDATVYSGETDFRFVNDTAHHILLHFTTDSEKRHMMVEIFGTPDGRQAEISNYRKWGASVPPPTVYFDDPTLPKGKVVQVDWSVGGIKTAFQYTVRDAEGKVMFEKEFTSNYIPWSAKYRRGI